MLTSRKSSIVTDYYRLATLFDLAEILRMDATATFPCAHAELEVAVAREEVYVIAAQDGDILGFIWYEVEGPDGWIQRLHVRKDMRGLRYGSALISMAHDGAIALGAREMAVYVWERDENALGCFERNGYSLIMVVNDDFGEGPGFASHWLGKDLRT